MKPITILIAKYSSIALTGFLINWWLFNLSNFNIPKNIPATPIHINSVTILIIVISTLIFAEKATIKIWPDISVAKLTFVGLLIGLFAEIVFQTIRVLTLDEDRLYYFSLGIIVMTAYDAAISFFIAFQIKTKNTNRLILYIIGFIILIRIIFYLLPSVS